MVNLHNDFFLIKDKIYGKNITVKVDQTFYVLILCKFIKKLGSFKNKKVLASYKEHRI